MIADISGVIRYIAMEQGVSEREVLEEMQRVIDAGYECQDINVQAAWAATPFSGKPTPQALLGYLAEKLKTETLH